MTDNDPNESAQERLPIVSVDLHEAKTLADAASIYQDLKYVEATLSRLAEPLPLHTTALRHRRCDMHRTRDHLWYLTPLASAHSRRTLKSHHAAVPPQETNPRAHPETAPTQPPRSTRKPLYRVAGEGFAEGVQIQPNEPIYSPPIRQKPPLREPNRNPFTHARTHLPVPNSHYCPEREPFSCPAGKGLG
jgi:hypothetical protein